MVQGMKVSIPNGILSWLEPPKARTLSIFSFQGSISRTHRIIADHLQNTPDPTHQHNLKTPMTSDLEPLRGSPIVLHHPKPSPPKDPRHFFSSRDPNTPPPAHSSKKDSIIHHSLPANPLNLVLTTLTEKIKPNTILLQLN